MKGAFEILIWALIPIMAALGFYVLATETASPPDVALSTVLISNDEGHGSGVHIGGGYIITAQHVVEDRAEMEVEDSKGKKQKGTIYWTNKTYDLALVHVGEYSGLGTSQLSCKPTLSIGESVKIIGNPFSMRFVRMWGRIAGIRQGRADWTDTIIINLTAAPGMSGGPMFDKKGNVAGIVVGVVMLRAGMGVAPFPISYVVPSQSVCKLMGIA